MHSATYLHSCTECSVQTQKKTSWINPAMFTDPNKAKKVETFWCSKCGVGQATEVVMLPENKVLATSLEYRSVVKDENGLFFKEDEESEEKENMVEATGLKHLSFNDEF